MKGTRPNTRNIEAIINLNDATEVGEKLFKPIFIAKNAEPHIADNITNKKKLFTGKILFKKLDFVFWFRYFYIFCFFHKLISSTIPQIICIIKFSYHSIRSFKC